MPVASDGPAGAVNRQLVLLETRQLLGKAETKSTRIIKDADFGDIFGIDLDDPAAPYGKQAAASGRKRPGKRSRGRSKTGR